MKNFNDKIKDILTPQTILNYNNMGVNALRYIISKILLVSQEYDEPNKNSLGKYCLLAYRENVYYRDRSDDIYYSPSDFEKINEDDLNDFIIEWSKLIQFNLTHSDDYENYTFTLIFDNMFMYNGDDFYDEIYNKALAIAEENIEKLRIEREEQERIRLEKIAKDKEEKVKTEEQALMYKLMEKYGVKK